MQLGIRFYHIDRTGDTRRRSFQLILPPMFPTTYVRSVLASSPRGFKPGRISYEQQPN